MPLSTQTRSETIVFTRPFSLPGLDAVQPPGRYVLEIEEELLPSVLHRAFRRRGAWLRLPALGSDAGGRVQLLPVDPAALEAALARDAGRPQDDHAGAAAPAMSQATKTT